MRYCKLKIYQCLSSMAVFNSRERKLTFWCNVSTHWGNTIACMYGWSLRVNDSDKHPGILKAQTRYSNKLINLTKQIRSLEASKFSGYQENIFILWQHDVHHRTHNSPPRAPILNQINPDHALSGYSLIIHFNVKIPSITRSSEWYVFFIFSTETLWEFLFYPPQRAPPTM